MENVSLKYTGDQAREDLTQGCSSKSSQNKLSMTLNSVNRVVIKQSAFMHSVIINRYRVTAIFMKNNFLNLFTL